ncbi:hypothetical protein [Billgrantia endophytica]|uniref:Uncharacterized protein n=1 Tax=Billgrantia endophytica TaxID=2033802 RepID=A0A2N7TV68_9GAMM|nr:hypothetical protein [Halomonas endophytica]PMR72066.1 hypothetical protein C1H69_22025 [Halomonas endophytica]
METESVSVLEFTLYKHSEASFLRALDEAGVAHSRTVIFSTTPQATGVKEVISAVSDAMPWNAIAKVIVAWIEARNNREVMITTDDGKIFHAKGYSAAEVKEFLPQSYSVMVIDTKPDEES